MLPRNAIRRALIADVPKLAITRVDFSQGVNQDNKGEVVESVNVLPDEVLAHRLAMIPIPTALDEGLVFPNECVNCMDVVEKDKGCPMCQVLYTLSARGPSRLRRRTQDRVCRRYHPISDPVSTSLTSTSKSHSPFYPKANL